MRGFGPSAPFLQPRFRLVGYPIGGLRLALKLTDLFNRPIRPVDLDNPTLTVTKYRAENWLCGHAVEAYTGGDQIRRRIILRTSRVRKPVQSAAAFPGSKTWANPLMLSSPAAG